MESKQSNQPKETNAGKQPSKPAEKVINLCEDMNSHSHNEDDYKIALEHQEKMKQKLGK